MPWPPALRKPVFDVFPPAPRPSPTARMLDELDRQLGLPTHEERVVALLEEIRDTLQGRRGLIALPSAAECERYGKGSR